MVITGIGTYLESEYESIRQISSDPDKLDETWEAWLKNKTRVQQQLLKKGIRTVDVLVRPNELAQYCEQHGVEINGANRAKFVQWKVSTGQY